MVPSTAIFEKIYRKHSISLDMFNNYLDRPTNLNSCVSVLGKLPVPGRPINLD